MLSVSWIYLVSDVLGCYVDATLPNNDFWWLLPLWVSKMPVI